MKPQFDTLFVRHAQTFANIAGDKVGYINETDRLTNEGAI